MGLYYQTEYRLGRGGGRICRSYTGLRAIVAIAVDLFFVLTFELFFGLLFLVLRNVTRIMAFVLMAVFYVLSLPFRAARWVSRTLEQRASFGRSEGADRATFKPAWAGFDDI
jgi:hypothetical protein